MTTISSCLVCGTPFAPQGSGHNLKKYCSKRCQRKQRRITHPEEHRRENREHYKRHRERVLARRHEYPRDETQRVTILLGLRRRKGNFSTELSRRCVVCEEMFTTFGRSESRRVTCSPEHSNMVALARDIKIRGERLGRAALTPAMIQKLIVLSELRKVVKECGSRMTK